MASDEVAVSTFTALEYLEASGWSMMDLAQVTGLHINTVRSALMGGSHKLNELSAERIAAAFGLEMDEIIWPVELTDTGRIPLTGGKYTTAAHDEHHEYCPAHFIELPNSGICQECAS